MKCIKIEQRELLHQNVKSPSIRKKVFVNEHEKYQSFVYNLRLPECLTLTLV